jgi:lipoprotein-anchoring transpeptidase ErfK/SrfK
MIPINIKRKNTIITGLDIGSSKISAIALEVITSGCVRMKNSDVEELYKIVPEGAEVVILD